MRSPIEAAASLPFARAVESIRAVVPRGDRCRVDRLPDGRTCVVFRSLGSGDMTAGDVTVLGPRMRARFKDATGVAFAVILQLKPGWARVLLGVPASELTDAYVPLEALWGRRARDLADRLRGATSLPAIFGTFAAAFSAHPAPPFEPASASLARRAAALFEGTAASRVDEVAAQLGVTARHLRRAFAENIGVSPKDFARAARLQRAVRAAGTVRDWASVASDAGYYDQAHLIADFHDLVGLTPSDYANRTRNAEREPKHPGVRWSDTVEELRTRAVAPP